MLDWTDDKDQDLRNGYNLYAKDSKTGYHIHSTPHAGFVYLTINVRIGNSHDPIMRAKNIANKVDGIVEDRDRQCPICDRSTLCRSDLEKGVSGALRQSIDAHGPIEGKWIGSAAKRVVQHLKHMFKQGIGKID